MWDAGVTSSPIQLLDHWNCTCTMNDVSIAKTTEFQTCHVLVTAKQPNVLLSSFNDEELNRYRVASTHIEPQAFGKSQEVGEQTKGPLASGGSGRAARPGSSPVGAEFPGAHRGLSPEGYQGACVWCVCVCKPRQARPRISRQPICVERAVNMSA